MGHIVNANATRLGWFKNWCDGWFVEHNYYPDICILFWK